MHLASFSSEHDYAPGSEQSEWLRRDLELAVANRGAVPWLVVSCHRPLLSADAGGWSAHRPGAPLLAAIEPLLFEHGVDLVLTGHEHCYERIHPNRNGTVLSRPDVDADRVQYTNPRGPVQIVQGTAGAGQAETWVRPPPAWSAMRLANGGDDVAKTGGPRSYASTFGFGRLAAFNATHLRYSFEPLAPPPDGRALRDDFWIVKT